MTTSTIHRISPKLLEELQNAADRVAQGGDDPEAMKKACRDMDRMRAATKKQLGELDIVVDLIREVRDDQ